MRRAGEGLRLAIVHVRSHSRQRQHVVTVMTLANVSMALLSQNGHAVGRLISADSESRMLVVGRGAAAARNRGRPRMGIERERRRQQPHPDAVRNAEHGALSRLSVPGTVQE